MRRFWSAPVATRASRLPSGESNAEGPEAGVEACVHAHLRVQAHRLQTAATASARRSTKPMANAMAINVMVAAAT